MLLVTKKLLQEQNISQNQPRGGDPVPSVDGLDGRNRNIQKSSSSGSGELAYHLDGAVDQLCAQRREGGHEVKGEGVGLPPETYQEANPDSPQHGRLSDHLINRRPVPVNEAVTL